MDLEAVGALNLFYVLQNKLFWGNNNISDMNFYFFHFSQQIMQLKFSANHLKDHAISIQLENFTILLKKNAREMI
jgi:hypothetical protein